MPASARAGLGSALVAVIGAAAGMMADAFSYALSAVCPGGGLSPEGAVVALGAEMVEGLAVVARHPVLRRVIVCAAAGNIFIARQISLTGTAVHDRLFGIFLRVCLVRRFSAYLSAVGLPARPARPDERGQQVATLGDPAARRSADRPHPHVPAFSATLRTRIAR